MVTPEQWTRVKAIFQTLAERPEKERETALRDLEAEDPAVRAEVRALLDAHREGGSLIGEALQREAEKLTGASDPDRAGQRFGSYCLIRCLGEGGMGEVWLAERADDAFHKQVAVKLVHTGLVTAKSFERFRTEREALARLEHPNIVRLLDGGTGENGAPYFVMEYVDGEPIEHYCETRGLSLAERLRLFVQVCAAVEEAHRNLIVHRDIKPGNVLVTGEGKEKLLDFGIAKLLDPETGSNLLTRTAITPATPAFASPEQLAGGPVTTATDVYALGILLFRLITGRHPYALESGQLAEVARVIRDTMPSRPSLCRRPRRAARGAGSCAGTSTTSRSRRFAKSLRDVSGPRRCSPRMSSAISGVCPSLRPRTACVTAQVSFCAVIRPASRRRRWRSSVSAR
jgi:serine/threonine protein kinase